MQEPSSSRPVELPVVEIETEKSAYIVEAPATGILYPKEMRDGLQATEVEAPIQFLSK